MRDSPSVVKKFWTLIICSIYHYAAAPYCNFSPAVRIKVLFPFSSFTELKTTPHRTSLCPQPFPLCCIYSFIYLVKKGRRFFKKALVSAYKSFFKEWWFIYVTCHHEWTLFSHLFTTVWIQGNVWNMCFSEVQWFIWTSVGCSLFLFPYKRYWHFGFKNKWKITNTTCVWFGSGLIT